MSRQPEQRCPICRDHLETVSGKHGIVLACLECQGGATTVAVLRKVAPKAFVDHLWQAAQGELIAEAVYWLLHLAV